MQFLGGTIGLDITETTFSSEIVRNLTPHAPFTMIPQSSLLVYTTAPSALAPNVVRVYVESLWIFNFISILANFLSLVFALTISNIEIRKKPETETESIGPCGDVASGEWSINSDGQPPMTEKMRSRQSS
ncbi:hypothetical protein PITC_060720 [Penicillium italicum]|uniref:Uncharacterized protein n=1 Tax=Penicillium italicum TaxID=40296 RepID=A0A0A2LFC4_PENIT|nr:hypothetical protein PITC_060720 [Penicillium italicum]